MKFRLIDRILAWQNHRHICGTKAVSFEEYCLPAQVGHPEHLPESLLLESLVQLGNWLLILSSDYAKMGLLLELQQVTFNSQLLPGQRVQLDVSIQQLDGDRAAFTGTGRRAGQDIITATWTMHLQPLSDYFNPADLRVLFDEISTPVPPVLPVPPVTSPAVPRQAHAPIAESP